MENERYIYETKCRRCGSLTEWYFADASQMDVFTFTQAMQDHVDHARVHRCNTCYKDTVQDVTFYGKQSHK